MGKNNNWRNGHVEKHLVIFGVMARVTKITRMAKSIAKTAKKFAIFAMAKIEEKNKW